MNFPLEDCWTSVHTEGEVQQNPSFACTVSPEHSWISEQNAPPSSSQVVNIINSSSPSSGMKSSVNSRVRSKEVEEFPEIALIFPSITSSSKSEDIVISIFSVEFGSDAKKFLKKAERQIAERIVKRIIKLKEDPFPSDVKRVVGKKDKIFRVRVGDYRIQYSVFYERNLIFISDIDKRERAFD